MWSIKFTSLPLSGPASYQQQRVIWNLPDRGLYCLCIKTWFDIVSYLKIIGGFQLHFMRALLTLHQCVGYKYCRSKSYWYISMIAAVTSCFSALKSSRKNLPIVFPINREISLCCGPSTWKLCDMYLHIKLVASLVASTRFASRIFPVNAVQHLARLDV